MDSENESRTCACGSRQIDLMRAPPPNKDWLRKTTCPRCGKIYWTDKDTDYCMDCNPVPITPSPKRGSA